MSFAADMAARKEWLSVLAKAPSDTLSELWEAMDLAPDFTWLRAPEIGAAMVRGRTGATGAAFNLGEMTVVRGSLQLTDGTVGHAYVAGRNKSHAEIAALCDALMQTNQASTVREKVLEPLERAMADTAAKRRSKAEKTKVEFFTMVRGENA